MLHLKLLQAIVVVVSSQIQSYKAVCVFVYTYVCLLKVYFCMVLSDVRLLQNFWLNDFGLEFSKYLFLC